MGLFRKAKRIHRGIKIAKTTYGIIKSRPFLIGGSGLVGYGLGKYQSKRERDKRDKEIFRVGYHFGRSY